MEGMEQMKQAQDSWQEKEKAGNPVNSSEEEEADMVQVGRSENMEPADESQGNSNGLKRKLGAKHKVLTKTIIYVLHNTQLTFSNLHLSRMVKQELKGT